jgi:methanogenic corrinoid protein MtbC1
VALHRHGWRIDYLGANTPLGDLTEAVAETRPDLVVLAAAAPELFDQVSGELAKLARTVRLAVAGAGAGRALARAVGARLLADDPVTAAELVSGTVP